MRKYVVPIVALAGIALLSPRADAGTLVIKSRAIPPAAATPPAGYGHAAYGTGQGNGSLPVSAVGIGGSTQLWGVDFALAFDTTKLAPGNDATVNAAFSPTPIATTPPETPVVVSGTTFVGTGPTGYANPNLYVGLVRGTSAFLTTSHSGNAAQPGSSIGLLRMQVKAGAAAYPYTNGATGARDVENLAIPPQYNVANTGDGSTTNSRPGTTGATSTATPGDPVVNETMTAADKFPGYAAPAAGAPETRMPLHMIAIGIPGDVNGDGTVSGSDATVVARALALISSAVTQWNDNSGHQNDYRNIAGDISPFNSYTPSSIFGSGDFGGSYGDGQVAAGDATFIARYAALVPSTVASFPQPE